MRAVLLEVREDELAHRAARQAHETRASFDRTSVKRAANLGRCQVLEPPDHP